MKISFICILLIAAISVSIIGSPPEVTLKLYEKANELYESGDFEESIEAYGKLIYFDDSFAHGYYGMGNAYFALDDFVNAANNYEIAVSLDPKFFQAFEWLGFAYMRLDNIDMAVEAWAKAFEITKTKYYVQLIEKYSGQVTTSVTGGQSQISLASELSESYESLPAAEFKERLVNYKKSGSLPAEAYYIWLSRANIESGSISEALKDWKKVIDITGSKIYLEKLFITDYPAFIVEADGALSEKPKSTTAQFFVASLLLAQSAEPARSYSLFEKVLNDKSWKSRFSEVYTSMAAIRYKQGNYDGALGLIEKAIKQNSKNGDAYALRGDIYLYKKKDMANAKVAYEKAVSNEPANTEYHDRLDFVTHTMEVGK
ncbi:tetratricopeptide repeat protein [bacterium]|nr:tetratricopeptide repeat protein [bacterium]